MSQPSGDGAGDSELARETVVAEVRRVAGGVVVSTATLSIEHPAELDITVELGDVLEVEVPDTVRPVRLTWIEDL